MKTATASKPIYADTSFFVSLYMPETHSEEARQWMKKQPRIYFTPLHHVELTHAIWQHVFRRVISEAQAEQAQRKFEQDRESGLWITIPVPSGAFETCVSIAKRHVGRVGSRTMDTLHVACALELQVSRFWTFDQRQTRLAHAVGLHER